MTAAVSQMTRLTLVDLQRSTPGESNDSWDQALAGWAGWCRAAGNAESTIRLRRTRLLAFAASCGKGPFDVTIGDCAAFVGEAGLAPNSRKVRRGSIRSFFVYAVETGLVDVDPTLRLPKPRAPRGLPRPCPDHIFEKAFAEATDRDRLILLLGALAGLRRAEIAGLRWDDVILSAIADTGHLRVTGKGGKERAVPLHPDLAHALAAERDRRMDGRMGSGYRYSRPTSAAVFPGRYGEPVRPNRIGQAAKALLGGQGTHSLRHRFGVMAYRGTHDLLAVSQLLGHASVAMTQTYAAADPDALTAAVLAAG